MKNISINIMKSLTEGVKSKLERNLKILNDLCNDWDFIGDATDPHICSIGVDGNTISVDCELFHSDLDDYVFYHCGEFEAPEIVNSIKKADLVDDIMDTANNYPIARDILDSISALLDWKTISDILYDEAHKEMEKYGIEPEEY